MAHTFHKERRRINMFQMACRLYIRIPVNTSVQLGHIVKGHIANRTHK